MKKIDAMHAHFGVVPDKVCKDCSNFIHGRYRTRTISKCTVYGATHSEASDWRMKYVACGMFNKEWNGNPIIRVLPRNGGFREADFKPMEGQVSIFDADE